MSSSNNQVNQGQIGSAQIGTAQIGSTVYIPRFVEGKLNQSLTKPIITMITGARQVGKSTLLNRLKDYVVKNLLSKSDEFAFENNVFSYTLDDIPLRAQLKKDITYLQKDIELALAVSIFDVRKPVYIFIDEIQKFLPLLDWIKQVYDRNSSFVKFVITGSSVTGFTKKLTETLAGRIEFVHLTPISLPELVKFRFNKVDLFLPKLIKGFSNASDTTQEVDNSTFNPEDMLASLEEKEQKDVVGIVSESMQSLARSYRTNIKTIVGTYLEHLFYGGMPKVYNMPVSQRQAVLQSYITVYLEREVGYVARNIDLELFGLSLSSFAKFNGVPINIQEIAKEVGIARPSIYRYLDLLEQTFLIKKIYPYPNTGKNKMKSVKLVYLDPGLLNVLLNISDIRELVTSPYLKQVVLSSFVLNLWTYLADSVGIDNIYYWQDYEDHSADIIIDLRDLTVVFLFDLANTTDNRKFITTLKTFAKYAKRDNILFVTPTWDVKSFTLDFSVKQLDQEQFGLDKINKNVYLLEAPVYMFV